MSKTLEDQDVGDSGEGGDTCFTLPDKITEVSPGVYLTNFIVEQDYRRLEKLSITHVLQVGAELEPSHPSKFTYLTVNIKDNQNADLLRILRPCLTYIANALVSGGHVLVHCMAGKSRSAAVVCAFLMWIRKLSFEKTMARLQASNAGVEINPAFVRQLQDFERLGSRKEDLPDTAVEDLLRPPGPDVERSGSLDSLVGQCAEHLPGDNVF